MAQNSGVTARRGPGRPFAKGRSGNPGGRPKVAPEVQALIKANTAKAIETVITLLDSENEKVALMAAREILDRSLGKPVQASEVQMDMNGVLNMRAEIRAFLLERERTGHDRTK